MTKLRTLSVSPTPSTAAYSSGDLVGGKLTFDVSQFARENEGGVVLDNVLVSDKAAQSANMDLVLFLEDPTTGTVFTDNAAFDIHDDDLSKVAAVVPVTTHHAFADNNVSRAVNLDLGLKLNQTNTDRNLYGALVSRATPTFPTATDLGLKLTLRSV